MSDLFAAPSAEESEVRRGLPGTVIVKTLATNMATKIMAKIPEADDDFLQRVKASQTSTAALDELVKDECGEELYNDEVATFDQDEVKKLLKSNQSNRSRRKSMPMTQSNYVEMLTAAVAEWIVRESCHVQKSTTGIGRGRHAIEFDETSLKDLENDQEELGRVIRNVQSKKSSYKARHKDNPDYEQDEEWLKLLEQEKTLKALRRTTPAGRKGVSVKKALQFIFDGVGATENLGKDESHNIIEACRELSKGIYPEEFMDMVAKQQAERAALELDKQAEEDATAEVVNEETIEPDGVYL